MPAVSKAQQRFMGMVHAAQKGDMEAPSKEVEKVADTMKKVDAKDFASTKHKGLPTHVKERIKEIIRGVMKEEGAFGHVIGGPEDGRNLNEMSPKDIHFKAILAMYDKGGSFTKKKVAVAVSNNPNASRNKIVDDLKDLDYHEILDAEDQLGIDESVINEEFKHVIHVDTPTQVVSKPIAAQIMALAKKGVRASEIGLEMGFVGNAKLAADTFQKVKNKIYFELDKRNESVNEAFPTKKVDAKVIADRMRNHKETKGFADKIEKLKMVSAEDLDKMLPDYVDGGVITKIFKESVNEGLSKDAVVRTLTSDKNAYFLTKDGNGWILDITPKAAQQSTFHQKFDVKDLGKGHLGMKYKLSESLNEKHDCGCNENHDCGCGGVHEHTHIHEDLSADANGIAGLTASRATAVKDFLEKNNINSNKLYLFLKKGNLKDRMDFVTALVGNPGNPIQKKVIKQFSN